jgi:hypothetical protein
MRLAPGCHVSPPRSSSRRTLPLQHHPQLQIWPQTVRTGASNAAGHLPATVSRAVNAGSRHPCHAVIVAGPRATSPVITGSDLPPSLATGGTDHPRSRATRAGRIRRTDRSAHQ